MNTELVTFFNELLISNAPLEALLYPLILLVVSAVTLMVLRTDEQGLAQENFWQRRARARSLLLPCTRYQILQHRE